jgi:hypothetical protein
MRGAGRSRLDARTCGGVSAGAAGSSSTRGMRGTGSPRESSSEVAAASARLTVDGRVHGRPAAGASRRAGRAGCALPPARGSSQARCSRPALPPARPPTADKRCACSLPAPSARSSRRSRSAPRRSPSADLVGTDGGKTRPALSSVVRRSWPPGFREGRLSAPASGLPVEVEQRHPHRSDRWNPL